MSGVCGISTMWWPGSFQTVSRGHILTFFNRHWSTMNLVKEKQGGLVRPGLKRWPFKLTKHFADTTRVSPSPACPAGCCPRNFLNLINLKFEWGLQKGAAYCTLINVVVFSCLDGTRCVHWMKLITIKFNLFISHWHSTHYAGYARA